MDRDVGVPETGGDAGVFDLDQNNTSNNNVPNNVATNGVCIGECPDLGAASPISGGGPGIATQVGDFPAGTLDCDTGQKIFFETVPDGGSVYYVSPTGAGSGTSPQAPGSLSAVLGEIEARGDSGYSVLSLAEGEYSLGSNLETSSPVAFVSPCWRGTTIVLSQALQREGANTLFAGVEVDAPLGLVESNDGVVSLTNAVVRVGDGATAIATTGDSVVSVVNSVITGGAVGIDSRQGVVSLQRSWIKDISEVGVNMQPSGASDRDTLAPFGGVVSVWNSVVEGAQVNTTAGIRAELSIVGIRDSAVRRFGNLDPINEESHEIGRAHV